MKVVVEREVSTATTGDIAVTAAEGGTGYWGRMDDYRWTRWMTPDTFECVEVPVDFVFYVIREDPDDDGTYSGKPMNVTPWVIRNGIQRYLSGVPGNVEARQFADMDDFGAMDAGEADCVVQLGLFGELRYG